MYITSNPMKVETYNIYLQKNIYLQMEESCLLHEAQRFHVRKYSYDEYIFLSDTTGKASS